MLQTCIGKMPAKTINHFTNRGKCSNIYTTKEIVSK
nr:MAG TPA: hypothetical protein [Caudoviricetes sp.]